MAAGSLITTTKQKTGPESAVMSCHAVSAETQTLENTSSENDEGGEPLSLYPLKQGVLSTIEKGLGPELGPATALIAHR